MTPEHVLSIQSHVVYGHVRNSDVVFPLQRLGRDVWPLIRTQFSRSALSGKKRCQKSGRKIEL